MTTTTSTDSSSSSSSSSLSSSPTNSSGSGGRIALDLNMGTAHLMDIIEGPAGYGADSVLIRYQAPCTVEDQDVEGDNPMATQQLLEDDNMTVKSASTAGSSTVAHRQQQRVRRRRRRLERRQLDDQIWFVVASIERFAKQVRHLSLRFVGCTFPAPALAWLLERVDRIETLQLRVTFHGSLGGLAKVLQRHPRLSQVTLDHCRPSLEDVTTTIKSSMDDSATGRAVRRVSRGKRAEENELKALDKSSHKKRQHHQQLKKKATPPRLASLEPLLDGLAQSKTLRSLTLSHTTIAFTASLPSADGQDTSTAVQPTMIAWNAGASLSQFLRMSSLKKLSLEHMTEVRDDDLATMASALETSCHTLKTLSIRQCAVGPLSGQALGRMLSKNTSLQTLDVNIHWWDGLSVVESAEGEYSAKCWETDVAALVQGLQTNTALKCLGLYCDNLAYTQTAAVVSMLGEYVEESTNQLCAAALQELPKVFQTQPQIKESCCSSSSWSSQKTTAPPTLNRALEDVIVGHRSFGLTPEIEFYLNWNRAGRNYFCEQSNATKYDWIDSLLNHRGNLSVVYALISMNPAMFQ